MRQLLFKLSTLWYLPLHSLAFLLILLSVTAHAQPLEQDTPTTRSLYLPTIASGTELEITPIPTVQPSPVPTRQPRLLYSTPILVSPATGWVWVANPDSGSVSLVDPVAMTKKAEIVTGGEPWALAISPDGQSLYVLDRAQGQLLRIETATQSVVARLAIGGEPAWLVLSPNGATAYVSLLSTSHIVVVDIASFGVTQRIPVDAMPYALALTDDGDIDDQDEQLLVTHFFGFQRGPDLEARDSGRAGRISLIDSATLTVTGTITLAPDANGSPNLLAAIATLGGRAWTAQVQAMPDLPNKLTSTLFASVATLDLIDRQQVISDSLPLNDQEIFGSPVNNPLAVLPSPTGDRLYVVLAGSDLIEVIDITTPNQPRLLKFLPTGSNPRGLALSSDGRHGYVMNYLARSVTLLDLEQLTVLGSVKVTAETLSPSLLRGKLLFNNAVNPKLSHGGWISCASCHPDGGSDSITWFFPDGPRQTPALWNAANTLPWHWSAALDEAQDVEETIQIIQHGLGLAPGQDPAQLQTPNAGRSADLDALTAFMREGIRLPSLAQTSEITQSQAISQGRALFQSAGCAACHGGANWTTSQLPGAAGTLDGDGNGMVDAVLSQVGTLNPRDIRGASGFDPPALLGIAMTAPYLHDGSMATLEELLHSGHPDPQGAGNGLSESEIVLLSSFLRIVDAQTEPIIP